MLKYSKKKLSIPKTAKPIHKQIVTNLERLITKDVSSPLHLDFTTTYKEILTLFHLYQKEVIKYSNYKVTCKRGCFYCCYHWVEDVYSFEAEIITDFIKKHFPENIACIIKMLREDEKQLIILNDIMEKKLMESRYEKELSEIDSTDLLLASFYQLKRPCALLADNGTCIIYRVRPLTCRTYVSFSNPLRCSQEYINESDMPTYLLDLEEDASKLLDKLHEKYNRFNKTGLRAILIDYLEE